MNNFFHTVAFTYKNKIKGKFFIISTFIFIALIILGMNFSTIKENFMGEEEGSSSSTVVINNQTDSYIINEDLVNEVFADNKVVYVKDEEQAKDILNESIENTMLKIEYNNELLYDISIITKRHSNSDVISKLNEVSKQLYKYSIMQQLEIDESVQGLLMTEPHIQYVNGEEGSESKMIISYIVVLACMILLNFYVQGVATTIVSEKNNRVIEVLLTSTKATELFFGKIIGNCLASITQISILILTAVITYNVSDFEPIVFSGVTLDLSIITKAQLFYIALFFVLGYLLYSIVAGALASFATNNDDLNQAILPVTISFTVSVVLAMAFMLYPNEVIIDKISYIPLFSPMVMMVKIIMVDISGTNILINIATLLITIIICALIGSKIYGKGTLNDSKKLSFSAMFR